MVHQHTFNVIALIIIVSSIFSQTESRPSDTAPNAKIVCKLPAARGHCRALLPRWKYNPLTGQCEEFDFGGCDGNGNNFMSYKTCMSACGGIS